MTRDKILVVSSDVVGRRMAGPAIRATELAKVLAREHRVLLAAPNYEPVAGLEVVSFRRRSLRLLVREAKVVISQGIGVPLPPLLAPGHALVLDWYDPNPVEVMAHHRDAPLRRARRSQEFLRRTLSPLAKRADHILCATQRQRDFWLGLLAAEGRLSWQADRSDPRLDDLISVAPFGLSPEPPRSTKPVLKGVWPGVGVKDKVLIWGGGIWNWFDPLTVIKAAARVLARRGDVRLFFLGVKHPNPAIAGMAMVQRAIDLSRDLGLLDKAIFFNHGWVDYDDRAGFLMESDLAVLAAGDDLETRLSFRTRLLDCLWAGLPMVVTEGDFFAELIRRRNLGRVVPVGDDRAMARAILALLDDEARLARLKENLARTAAEFTWDKVLAPLVEYCAGPGFHPGAVHSKLGATGLVAKFGLGVLSVVARYGGAEIVIKRLLRKD